MRKPRPMEYKKKRIKRNVILSSTKEKKKFKALEIVNKHTM